MEEETRGETGRRGQRRQAGLFFSLFFYELSLCVRYRCYKQEVS